MKQPNTKQLILSTALDLFSKHGYAGASIRHIARSIGIRESAIYNHYKSKEEIFSAILSEFKAVTISEKILSDDLIEDLVNPEKFLKRFVIKLISQWSSATERKFIRLLLMEQFTKIGSTELSVSGYLIELRSICKMIFSEMSKHNIIKKVDPEILANQFTAPLFLIRTEYMTNDDVKEINKVYDLANKHVEFFWNAVKL